MVICAAENVAELEHRIPYWYIAARHSRELLDQETVIEMHCGTIPHRHERGLRRKVEWRLQRQ